MYRLLPLRILRQTTGIKFDEIPQCDIPDIHGIDRVIHGPNGISPGPVKSVKRPWYMHTHQDDNLLVNEIAPRVHNSGHLTINAFNISQFENHVRAVCNLGLEKVEKISNAEMFNVLGKDIETYRSKKFNNDEFFYDYGKKSIKDKRKMGHLTVLKK